MMQTYHNILHNRRSVALRIAHVVINIETLLVVINLNRFRLLLLKLNIFPDFDFNGLPNVVILTYII